MRTVALPYTGRYAVASAVALLEAHTIPGLERHNGRHHERLLTGATGPVAVETELRDDHAFVTLHSDDPADEAPILATARRWFAVDRDPLAAEQALAHDPILGPLIADRPGLRVLGYPDGFEAAILTVLGQQVSLAAARTFGGRLVAAYGTAGPSGLRVFPAAGILAAVPHEELRAAVGLTGSRARTVQALAAVCAAGLAVSPDGDHATIRAHLLSVPGIGPWTVEYLAVRALHDADAYPSGDLVLKKALGVSTAKDAVRAAESWSPHRAFALFHLWTHAVYGDG